MQGRFADSGELDNRSISIERDSAMENDYINNTNNNNYFFRDVLPSETNMLKRHHEPINIQFFDFREQRKDFKFASPIYDRACVYEVDDTADKEKIVADITNIKNRADKCYLSDRSIIILNSRKFDTSYLKIPQRCWKTANNVTETDRNFQIPPCGEAAVVQINNQHYYLVLNGQLCHGKNGEQGPSGHCSWVRRQLRIKRQHYSFRQVAVANSPRPTEAEVKAARILTGLNPEIFLRSVEEQVRQNSSNNAKRSTGQKANSMNQSSSLQTPSAKPTADQVKKGLKRDTKSSFSEPSLRQNQLDALSKLRDDEAESFRKPFTDNFDDEYLMWLLNAKNEFEGILHASELWAEPSTVLDCSEVSHRWLELACARSWRSLPNAITLQMACLASEHTMKMRVAEYNMKVAEDRKEAQQEVQNLQKKMDDLGRQGISPAHLQQINKWNHDKEDQQRILNSCISPVEPIETATHKVLPQNWSSHEQQALAIAISQNDGLAFQVGLYELRKQKTEMSV